ncbi:MAG: YfiR family protein [Candidatus Acidiferrales bacterium]
MIVSQRRMRVAFRVLTALAMVFAVGASPSVLESAQPTRFEVEAAYLYQFGNFVEWPSKNPKVPGSKYFSICVLGRDPFGRVLDDTLSGSKLNGLPMVARRIDSVEDARDCQILFFSSSRRSQLDSNMSALHDAPILTVSDIADFASRGGMIQFVLIDGRVRFEINLPRTQKAGLKLSSQLLKVAAGVRRSDKKLKE